MIVLWSQTHGTSGLCISHDCLRVCESSLEDPTISNVWSVPQRSALFGPAAEERERIGASIKVSALSETRAEEDHQQ